MEVEKHVYMFEVATETNEFYPVGIETRTGLTLIDTGPPGSVEALIAELDGHGFTPDDVSKVICSHQDIGPIGSLKELLGRTDAEIFAHKDDAPYINGEKDPIKRPDSDYAGVPVDVELNDGEVFSTKAGDLEVIFVPGHAPGQLAFYLPDHKLLLCADALGYDDGLSGPSEEFTLEMDEAYQSLDAFTRLDIERTLAFQGGLTDAGTDDIAAIQASHGQ